MTLVPTHPESAPPASRWSGWLLALVLPVIIGIVAVYAVAHWPGEQSAAADPQPVAQADAKAAPKNAKANDERYLPEAPELDGVVAWLYGSGPIRLKDLRGKIVLLDFWTLCCINCIHTLPDLARLEKKYPNQLVVIGVHSAKFENEKNSESIRKAILRYEISHPVVNDARMKIWRTYGVRSWPTLALIDPEGKFLGATSGEGRYDLLDKVIARVIDTHRKKKTLNEQPLRFDLARFRERGNSPLFFPGKVLADAANKRLFIADSTHHRIVITDLDGKKIAIAGAGEPGRKDGPFDQATFNDPQGMALKGDVLYVADRKNHMIRQLDLKAGTVKTIAGIGTQGDNRQSGGPALKTGLNSPWDLYLHKGKLFIAMAGHHQVWTLDLDRARLDPYAGAGGEDIQDGPAGEALFAQPSGLASDGKTLYVADSEVSAIRAVALGNLVDVKTIVGQGLFEFGDIDGTGDKVRLQHALGIAFHDGKLYVADTYNSKIKVIDPLKRTCSTFLGEPAGWFSESLFNEPGGLSFAGDKLYVADTNAHRIRVVDLKTRSVSTLPLQGVEAPKRAEVSDQPEFPNPRKTTLAVATVPSDGELTLQVEVRLPKGFKLNNGARMAYVVETLPGAKKPWSETRTLPDPAAAFKVTVPVAPLAGASGLRMSLVYFECGEGSEAVCRIKSQIWEIPLKFDPTAKDRVIYLQAPGVATDDSKK